MSKLSLGDIGWHCPYHQIGQCLDFYWMTLASQPDLSISRFYRMSSEKCHHMILLLPSDMSMLEFDWMVFRESHRKMFIEDFLSSENCPQMILQLSSNLSSFELYHKMFHKMTFLSSETCLCWDWLKIWMSSKDFVSPFFQHSTVIGNVIKRSVFVEIAVIIQNLTVVHSFISTFLYHHVNHRMKLSQWLIFCQNEQKQFLQKCHHHL